MQQRDKDLGGDRAQRGGQHDDHLSAERLQVASQAPQCPDWPDPGGGVRDQQRGYRGHYREVNRTGERLSPDFSCGVRLVRGA